MGAGRCVVNIEETMRAIGLKYELLGFLDSDPEKLDKEFFGHKVIGHPDWLKDTTEPLNVICYINCHDRYDLVTPLIGQKNLNFPNIIHPSAIISKKAQIGFGNIFAQYTVVAPYTEIGNFNHFNYMASVGHHCKIGSYNSLHGGCHIAGLAQIKDKVLLAPGAVVIEGAIVGEGAKIGANAVVIRDIPPNVTAVGLPAKVIKTHKDRNGTR